VGHPVPWGFDSMPLISLQHAQSGLAFLPGSVGGLEVVVLFAIVLILFGPRRLPQVARDMGRMMQHLRKASDQFRDQLMQMDEEEPLPPVPDPGVVDVSEEEEPSDG
jgi:sec-independent protein translocase protein TatA